MEPNLTTVRGERVPFYSEGGERFLDLTGRGPKSQPSPRVTEIVDRVVDIQRMRAMQRAANPTTAFQPVNPVVESLVIGQQMPLSGVAEEVFTTALVPNVNFQYWTYGAEHLDVQDTLRGESEPYRYSDFSLTATTGSLKRRSWATMADIRTLANADPSIRLQVKKALQARRTVLQSEEKDVADILQTTGTTVYATGHTSAISAGDEWDDADGPMQAQVAAGVQAIITDMQVQPSDIKLFLPQSSYIAALANPGFRTARQYTVGPRQGTAQDLAEYFGIGEVIVRNLVKRTPSTGVVAPMYADIAVLFVAGQMGEYDREFGERQFAVRFAMNEGVSSEPYYEDSITSWVFPYNRESAFAILNTSAGYLFTNTSAAV